MCPMLCLGRKGQTLDPLVPADTGLSRLHLIDVVFGPEGKFEKLFCKAIRCQIDQLHPYYKIYKQHGSLGE